MFSVLFLLAISSIWAYVTNSYDPNLGQLETEEEVNNYLARLQIENAINLPKSKNRIPTGIFLQSLKFNNSSEVNLTGYVWQTQATSFCQGDLSKVPVGFIFPEAIESGNNIAPRLTYCEPINDGREVIGWYFETTLKQRFEYSKYPFDHKTVWVRLWSSSFGQKELLVPDLSAYADTREGSTFGYDKDIVLGHWRLIETFFDYKLNSYNSDFGVFDGGKIDAYPELYFNVVIERHFLNSFVVYILPLSIIACLVFASVMMITKDPERASSFGFSASGVIGVCSGLFFVVLVSQVQIRREFAGTKVVYIEFFYPVMYVTFLAVSVNSYLFALPNPGNNRILNLIEYEDNLLPKVLYWPLLLGSVTAITAIILLPQSYGELPENDYLTYQAPQVEAPIYANDRESLWIEKLFSANQQQHSNSIAFALNNSTRAIAWTTENFYSYTTAFQLF